MTTPKVASSKAKGRRLQQFVRDLLLSVFPTLESDDIKSTSMGVSGEDIQLSPLARKKFPYSVECKSRKSLGIYTWYEQAQKNTPKGTKPLLVVKADRRDPLVVLDAETFFNLVGEKK